MKVYYDLHIHTAASPCGDEMMSPHNIVNMAKLKGLDVIAITDHQTCLNCKAVQKVGQDNDLLVVAGMEIECEEEFHMIALFPSYEIAQQIETYIKTGMPKIKNNIQLFGRQQCLNEKDEVIGEIEDLLLMATKWSASEIVQCVTAVGGVIYPAHIDRNSYSIISQLGGLPSKPIFNTLEISKTADLRQYTKQYKAHQIIISSDAHYLQDISEANYFLELNEKRVQSLLDKLKTQSCSITNQIEGNW